MLCLSRLYHNKHYCTVTKLMGKLFSPTYGLPRLKLNWKSHAFGESKYLWSHWLLCMSLRIILRNMSISFNIFVFFPIFFYLHGFHPIHPLTVSLGLHTIMMSSHALSSSHHHTLAIIIITTLRTGTKPKWKNFNISKITVNSYLIWNFVVVAVYEVL